MRSAFGNVVDSIRRASGVCASEEERLEGALARAPHDPEGAIEALIVLIDAEDVGVALCAGIEAAWLQSELGRHTRALQTGKSLAPIVAELRGEPDFDGYLKECASVLGIIESRKLVAAHRYDDALRVANAACVMNASREAVLQKAICQFWLGMGRRPEGVVPNEKFLAGALQTLISETQLDRPSECMLLSATYHFLLQEDRAGEHFASIDNDGSTEYACWAAWLFALYAHPGVPDDPNLQYAEELLASALRKTHRQRVTSFMQGAAFDGIRASPKFQDLLAKYAHPQDPPLF